MIYHYVSSLDPRFAAGSMGSAGLIPYAPVSNVPSVQRPTASLPVDIARSGAHYSNIVMAPDNVGYTSSSSRYMIGGGHVKPVGPATGHIDNTVMSPPSTSNIGNGKVKPVGPAKSKLGETAIFMPTNESVRPIVSWSNANQPNNYVTLSI